MFVRYGRYPRNDLQTGFGDNGRGRQGDEPDKPGKPIPEWRQRNRRLTMRFLTGRLFSFRLAFSF